ncbi:uncharacterized protein MELLADRAFT_112529 [Melampsora larici-populina 98AG31]|uniref:Uncharacterized protein n=1 Tax=Melampsora larici-populina (strain 98AG31 / pathotype 3-4-7) TaxID=747676 RepID=F4S6S4_MELLP|nr:uncharacterized protein MELLADRAFT_112529 [Melampsora larici-populina 98AG31]EGF99667.1 hypothetical protein MELLADRAFT_112529 [Melampsora larici-populina 98AG31]
MALSTTNSSPSKDDIIGFSRTGTWAYKTYIQRKTEKKKALWLVAASTVHRRLCQLAGPSFRSSKVSPEEDSKVVALIDIVSPEEDCKAFPLIAIKSMSVRLLIYNLVFPDIPTPTTMTSNTRRSHSEIYSPAIINTDITTTGTSNTASTSDLSAFTNHSSVACIGSHKFGADKVEGPRKRLIGSEQTIETRPAKRLMTLSTATTAGQIRPPSQVRYIGASKRAQSIMTGTKNHIEGPQITLPSPLFASTHNQTSNTADSNSNNTSGHNNHARTHVDQAFEHQSTVVPVPEHPNCNCHQMMGSLLLEIHGHLDRIAGLLSHFQA